MLPRSTSSNVSRSCNDYVKLLIRIPKPFLQLLEGAKQISAEKSSHFIGILLSRIELFSFNISSSVCLVVFTFVCGLTGPGAMGSTTHIFNDSFQGSIGLPHDAQCYLLTYKILGCPIAYSCCARHTLFQTHQLT